MNNKIREVMYKEVKAMSTYSIKGLDREYSTLLRINCFLYVTELIDREEFAFYDNLIGNEYRKKKYEITSREKG